MDGKPAGMTANVPHGTIEFSRKEELCVAKIVAIANQKGGVGKTTTAVNLSSCVAALGKRVLCIDIDPQGNCTSGLGVDKDAPEHSIYDVMINGVSAAEATVKTPTEGLDLICARKELSGAEVELVNTLARETVLKRALDKVRKNYDYIFIDCPPSLGLLTINALTAADTLLAPIQCEYYALEGLSQLIHTVNLVRERLNPTLDIEGIVFTMYDARTNLSMQVVENVKDHLNQKVYKTMIPRNIRLAEAPSYGMPINLYDAKSAGAESSMALADEVIKRKGI